MQPLVAQWIRLQIKELVRVLPIWRFRLMPEQ
jgi:hypothetical protein